MQNHPLPFFFLPTVESELSKTNRSHILSYVKIIIHKVFENRILPQSFIPTRRSLICQEKKCLHQGVKKNMLDFPPDLLHLICGTCPWRAPNPVFKLLLKITPSGIKASLEWKLKNGCCPDSLEFLVN